MFRLHVDADGTVSRATLLFGPAERRADAVKAARALRFKPFEVDGRRTSMQFEFAIASETQDYVGPPNRAFPAQLDPREIRIALKRTTCFGTCPDYWVEVRGDGQVSYRGSAFVVVEGVQHWKIDPAAAARLVERFRSADYFKLDGYYTVDVTDIPTYVTRVSVGQQRKFVFDYGGGMPDGPMAPRETARMPPVVTELEDAIDAVSGVSSWVRGDEHTMTRLREARWDFKSRAAARGLIQLVSDCNVGLAEDFIRAGTPVWGANQGSASDSAIAHAAYCGSRGLVRLLEARGALAKKKDADAFLDSAVRHGRPEFVAIALQHHADVRRRSADGKPYLFNVADTHTLDASEVVGDAKRDLAEVVRQLVAAGADPNARDKEGNAPLHEVADPEVALALVKAGADPNARNEGGQTPLFNQFWSDVKTVLVRVGADVSARDSKGRTALFNQRDASTAQALVNAGADVNATAHDGSTPLETAYEEGVALLLLNAGATLPSDPKRLSVLIDRARERKWEELLRMLLRASNGSSSNEPKPGQ